MNLVTMIAFASLALALPASAQQDVLKLRNGTEVKGKITQLTATTVTYTDAAGKSAPALKAEEVSSILFSDTPASLKGAMAAVTGKNWAKALAQCETAIGEIGPGKARDLHKQYILLEWAKAFDGDGKADKALEKLRALRTECGNCFLRPESFQRSLEISRRLGDTAVEALLGEMEREPEPMASTASLERARMLYGKADFEKALGAFTRLEGASGSPLVGEARLGMLRCYRALKKQGDLESLCRRVMDDRRNSTPALVQSAAASLGDVQARAAGTDKAKLHDALILCSQAIAMGPPPKDQSPEDYAIALLNAARCCASLSKVADKAESKTEYRNRATAYYSELASFYKSTEWGAAALKERAALGGGDEKPKTP